MTRYIDADWFVRWVKRWKDSLEQTYGENDEYVICLSEVLNVVDDAPTTDVYDALKDYVTDDTHVDIVMRMIADIWEKMNPGYGFKYEVWSEKIWNTPKE